MKKDDFNVKKHDHFFKNDAKIPFLVLFSVHLIYHLTSLVAVTHRSMHLRIQKTIIVG